MCLLVNMVGRVFMCIFVSGGYIIRIRLIVMGMLVLLILRVFRVVGRFLN